HMSLRNKNGPKAQHFEFRTYAVFDSPGKAWAVSGMESCLRRIFGVAGYTASDALVFLSDFTVEYHC
ncbi:MAG: hypothetical protein LIO94_06190, partial [Clostridiales bacterium]|nr:hypothetical protein [Clostridiales bacterium]